MTPPTIRPRRTEDLPALGRALIEQQPTSGYPHRDPLPMGPEDFIVRSGELAAWVAEVDGDPVGHVAISAPADPATTDPGDAEIVRAWLRAHGRRLHEIGEVSVFFTAATARGTGAGAALLATAVGALRERDLAPCLDVNASGASARRLYRRSGWQEIGTARPGWLSPNSPDVLLMVLPTG